MKGIGLHNNDNMNTYAIYSGVKNGGMAPSSWFEYKHWNSGIFSVYHEENHPLQVRCGLLAWKFPLSTAKFLIDAVGYVCSESAKCDAHLPQTLGDVLTLSLAVTLKQI